MGRRAAWGWAEKATAALGEYVADTMPASMLLLDAVEATAVKLKGAR